MWPDDLTSEVANRLTDHADDMDIRAPDAGAQDGPKAQDREPDTRHMPIAKALASLWKRST